jgi:hypothetical protein
MGAIPNSLQVYPRQPVIDLQKLANRQSHPIRGILRTTVIGPLVKEAGLRSADLLLAHRQRRYTTRAFE